MKRLFLAVLIALSSWDVGALAEEIDLAKFAQETQKVLQADSSVLMIWWVPTEYWQESLKKTGLTQTQKDAFIKALDDYIIFFVVDSKISPLGTMTAKSKEEVAANFSLSAGKYKNAKAIPDDNLSAEAKNILAMMKPGFGQMLGQIGKGMEFLCYEGKDAQGNKLLDPKKEGKITVKYGSKYFQWRLPLGALLPPKYDPKTNEKFPGNYSFNPFTGTALVAAPSAKEQDNDIQ
jgi:hypothetical protein